MRKWIIIICLLAVTVKGALWWDGRGDGFELSKIQSNLPVESRWDFDYTPEQYQQALKVLQQPYKYLAHGFQCYAFESQDGLYVLKFFRHQRLRLSNFTLNLPAIPVFEEWRTAKILSMNRRREYLLRSCKTAQKFVPYESGLIYTHLNTTNNLFPTVEITDKLGNHYQIELDNYQFILQFKAEHIKPVLSKLAREGKLQEAKVRIDQIFALLADCANKGIQDADSALIYKNNLGFLSDRAIYIDGGKLIPKESMKQKDRFIKDLNRLKPLLKWMKENEPTLVPLYQQSEKEAIDRF